MKTVKKFSQGLFYVFIGGAFFWLGADRSDGFFAAVGLCWMALAAWEFWTVVQVCREGREIVPGWRMPLDLGQVLIAACFIRQGLVEPSGTNVVLAVLWMGLGAVYGARAVRTLCKGRSRR